MTRTELRDRVLGWVIGKLFFGPWLDRICIAVIVAAVLYFSPVLLSLAGYDYSVAEIVGYVLARL